LNLNYRPGTTKVGVGFYPENAYRVEF